MKAEVNDVVIIRIDSHLRIAQAHEHSMLEFSSSAMEVENALPEAHVRSEGTREVEELILIFRADDEVIVEIRYGILQRVEFELEEVAIVVEALGQILRNFTIKI